jgi:hypothetical protein
MIRSWISGLDFSQIAYYATLVLLILGLIPTAFLTWTNVGSRNLVFAAASLGGAIVFFLINFLLELRPSTSSDKISAEFYVNRPAKSINFVSDEGQKDLHTTSIIRPASQWLASNNPTALAKEGSQTLTSDLIVFSMVVFLMEQEPDWQFKPTRYTGQAPGISGSTFFPFPISGEKSPKSRCTFFRGADFRSRLAQAKNLFATAPGLSDDTAICLPPKSIVEISKETLKIWNPVSQLSFEILGGMFASSASLHEAQGDFETVLLGIRVETTYSRWRAHTSDIDKYRDWSARVVSGLKTWLEK